MIEVLWRQAPMPKSRSRMMQLVIVLLSTAIVWAVYKLPLRPDTFGHTLHRNCFPLIRLCQPGTVLILTLSYEPTFRDAGTTTFNLLSPESSPQSIMSHR